jgi:purine-binding chemotaxis protein CheW
LMGLMTDSVDAVLDIPPEEIQPPPSMGNSIDASLIKGMGKTDDRFLIILDLERLILQDEIQAIMDKTAV